jgi:hypothetical protein
MKLLLGILALATVMVASASPVDKAREEAVKAKARAAKLYSPDSEVASSGVKLGHAFAYLEEAAAHLPFSEDSSAAPQVANALPPNGG